MHCHNVSQSDAHLPKHSQHLISVQVDDYQLARLWHFTWLLLASRVRPWAAIKHLVENPRLHAGCELHFQNASPLNACNIPVLRSKAAGAGRKDEL